METSISDRHVDIPERGLGVEPKPKQGMSQSEIFNHMDTLQNEGGVDPALAARVKQLFAQHDADNNGTLDVREVIAIACQIEKDKKSISNMRMIIIWGAAAIILLLGAMVATSIVAAKMTQEQYVTPSDAGSSRMQDADGNTLATSTLKLGCSFCAESRGETNTDFDDVAAILPEDAEWETYDKLSWSGSQEAFNFEVAASRYNRKTKTRYIDTNIPNMWLEYTLDQPPLLHRVQEVWTDETRTSRKEQWLPLGGDWEDTKETALGASRRRLVERGAIIYRRRLLEDQRRRLCRRRLGASEATDSCGVCNN